jgi:hydrogenase expression/formation protein HypE
MQKSIALSHGNGGAENQALIRSVFYKHFKNELLERSEDAAVFQARGNVAMTTDAFTVSPRFFPGGDIGKLAVCGTSNDIAMMGAAPRYMTCSFVIEEGFATRELEKIVRSMKAELAANETLVVGGDTKVVPKGAVDGLFITTTGFGEVYYEGLSSAALRQGDVILVSRDIGAHGATIFAARESIGLESDLQSDCASLFTPVRDLLESGAKVRALRDATRGGVAAVLNEWAQASDVCIETDEADLPVSEAVRGICEMLGFEAYDLANEGTFVVAVAQEDASKALDVLKAHHPAAARIGEVSERHKGKVVLRSSWGTHRFMELPTGELLPRIC